MTATATKTRAEALALREAYKLGADRMYIHKSVPATPETIAAIEEVAAAAEKYYPLPKVERPREVDDITGRIPLVWRYTNGMLQWRSIRFAQWNDSTKEGSGMFVYAARVTLLADLVANPNELVDE